MNIAHLDFSPVLGCQLTFEMGATLSHFAYASHQQPDPRSHQHVSQLHQCLEPTLILGNENAASSTIIDLYTRLTALEKDLKISQLGNIEKEAVIQYLLQSSISNARVKESTTKLKEQLLLLKTTIDQKNKENKEIKDKLGKAEDTICALSRRSVLNSRSQSTSTSFSSRSDSPPKSEVVTEDLIDLSDCSQESDSAKLTEGDSTLLDDIYEDQLDVEDIKTDITPGQSSLESRDSLDSELQDFPYLVHFADSDGEDVSKEGDAHMTQVWFIKLWCRFKY